MENRDSTSFETTKEIKIPKDDFDKIIGQPNAVRLAKIALKQKRNLLLVGPPGIGKSMIAQAMASSLDKPRHEISVLHNSKQPEKPIVEVKTKDQIKANKEEEKRDVGKFIPIEEVPIFVAERLGLRCRRCSTISDFSNQFCPRCGNDKTIREVTPFKDLLGSFENERFNQTKIFATKTHADGREETFIFERVGTKIKVSSQSEVKTTEERRRQAKIILPLERKNFIIATGASETELLGDVQHDPYGGHAHLGTAPYKRVLPGALHEAHEGILFIDELATLNDLQRFILTAMQEKKFPIIGRNPTSSGASVKVENVPCDFILVAACNINDLNSILPPLRSRIVGNGYEVLLDTSVEDTETNRSKFVQFVAQEISKDGKIPHANFQAVNQIIEEARKKARQLDNTSNALTLRLRSLSGLIKLAGDVARTGEKELIDKQCVEEAVTLSKTAEQQMQEKYGSVYKANASEYQEEKSNLKEIS